MAKSEILDRPVKHCPEFMTVNRPDHTDAKRELFDDGIDKADGIGLRMFLVDLQCTEAGCIVHCGI